MVPKADGIIKGSHPLSILKTYSEEPKRRDYYYDKCYLGDRPVVVRTPI